MVLGDKGIIALPLGKLKARLAPHGYVICATKGRHPQQLVACSREDGRVGRYEPFELRRTSPLKRMFNVAHRASLSSKAACLKTILEHR